MTRKDYERIASRLATQWDGLRVKDDKRITQQQNHQMIGFRTAVEAVAIALVDDNPRFDQSRFYDAVFQGGMAITYPAVKQ